MNFETEAFPDPEQVDRNFIPNELTSARLREIPGMRPTSAGEVKSAVERVAEMYRTRREKMREKMPVLDWEEIMSGIKRRELFEKAELSVFLSFFDRPDYRICRFDDQEMGISGWVAFAGEKPERAWLFKSSDLKWKAK
jgi:hypothetical protein